MALSFIVFVKVFVWVHGSSQVHTFIAASPLSCMKCFNVSFLISNLSVFPYFSLDGKWIKLVLVPASVLLCSGVLLWRKQPSPSNLGLLKSVRLCLIPQFVLLRSCSGLFASSLLGAETAPPPS